MKSKGATQSVRIDKEVVKEIKRFIIDEGGTIRSVLEDGARLKISKKKK